MNRKTAFAFTLIETLAAVTAVSILAAALLVPMIRKLDALALKKESEALKQVADAFRSHVLTSSPKNIPSHLTWATNVANRLGITPDAVTNNGRGLRRVFLIDPALAFGPFRATNLPYSQNLANTVGFTNAPINARFMLVSSLSGSLPSALVSGVAASSGANAFDNLWATADGQVPSGWTWNGRGEDLLVERFNIADLFVQVILNNRDTNLIPRYQIEDASLVGVPYGGRRSHFIKGTELKLFNAIGALEYSEILAVPKSFTFEYGTWQGEAFVGHSVSQTSPLDLQKVMNTFMNSPTNPAAKFGASQLAVSNALVAFLNEYILWRDAGYPGQFSGQGNPPKSLEDAQTALVSVTGDLLTRP